MSDPSKKAILFRMVFYLAATAFILIVWQYQKNLLGGVVLGAVDPSAASMKDQELNALLEMNRLITGLGTGLLGAIGFMLVNRQTNRGSAAMWAACVSAVCVGLSLFFGYVVYLAVITMLQFQIFDLTMPSVVWARQAHFYFFLLAVVLFGDFAFNNLRREGGNGQKEAVVHQ